MKRLLLSLPLILLSLPAWAVCGVSTVQVKDNAAATSAWTALNDGTNCAGETGLIWGGAALSLANALPVQPGTGATWAATQSGTWTVQPGNTANTTPWLATISQGGNSATVSAGGALKVDSSAATQPVNVSQIGGSSVSTAATGVQKVGVVGNAGAAFDVATGAAPPANALYTGTLQSGATGGHVGGIIQCDKQVTKHITTATDTLAVQGVASQTIYVCGVEPKFAGSAAQAIFLENTASANANCSSANTQIAGTYTGSATGPTYPGFYNPFWGGLKNTSGNGLCINSTGTGPVDVDVYYTQF